MSDPQLSEQFTKALSIYSAKNGSSMLQPDPIKRYWEERRKVDGGGASMILEAVASAAWAARYPTWVRDIEEALQELKSPIESMMLSALMIAGYDIARHVRLRFYDASGKAYEFGDDGNSPSMLLIEAQKRVGAFRVDFVLTYRESAIDEDRCSVSLANEIILECDGHAFHDRTQQQASADRKRDRALQRHGIQVFRFTGSDIWRDPFACAGEALATVSRRDDLRRIPQAVAGPVSLRPPVRERKSAPATAQV